MSKIVACPYCGVVLETPPKRKKPCPECQKPIFVRAKVLVTEDRAHEIDAIHKLEGYGITEEQFLAARTELSKRFGLIAPVSDTVWTIYNKLLNSAISSQNYSQLKILYMSMAMHLYSEGRAGFFALLGQSHKMDLLDMKNSGFAKKVRITNVNDNLICDACKAHEDKIYSIDDALRDSILPVANCTHGIDDKQTQGYCRCWYVAV